MSAGVFTRLGQGFIGGKLFKLAGGNAGGILQQKRNQAALWDFDFKAAVIDTIDGDLTALGGVIALSPTGEIIMRFNTQGMYRGSVSSVKDVEVSIYGQAE